MRGVKKSGLKQVMQLVQDVQLEAQRKETKLVLKSCTETDTSLPKQVYFALDLISGGDLSNYVHKGLKIESR